jgi:integrase
VLKAGRERRVATPAAARHFLVAMRGLFHWALEAGHVAGDPTIGVKNPAKPKAAGFPPWTEDDVTKYEARWPRGTKERVWLDVLQYTGLRRGDAVTFGRQHIKDGVGTIRTEKSGGEITVTIPILPALAETLAAGRRSRSMNSTPALSASEKHDLFAVRATPFWISDIMEADETCLHSMLSMTTMKSSSYEG